MATYLTWCDACADKIDARKHSDGTYYLEIVPGSRRAGRCEHCGRAIMVTQYEATSKATIAMHRALAKRAAETYKSGRDKRARYREPFRAGAEE